MQRVISFASEILVANELHLWIGSSLERRFIWYSTNAVGLSSLATWGGYVNITVANHVVVRIVLGA